MGSHTTPRLSAPKGPPEVLAIETAQCGKPRTKLAVPSSGSTIQVGAETSPPDAAPSDAPRLLAEEPVARERAEELLRRTRASLSRSAFETTSFWDFSSMSAGSRCRVTGEVRRRAISTATSRGERLREAGPRRGRTPRADPLLAQRFDHAVEDHQEGLCCRGSLLLITARQVSGRTGRGARRRRARRRSRSACTGRPVWARAASFRPSSTGISRSRRSRSIVRTENRNRLDGVLYDSKRHLPTVPAGEVAPPRLGIGDRVVHDHDPLRARSTTGRGKGSVREWWTSRRRDSSSRGRGLARRRARRPRARRRTSARPVRGGSRPIHGEFGNGSGRIRRERVGSLVEKRTTSAAAPRRASRTGGRRPAAGRSRGLPRGGRARGPAWRRRASTRTGSAVSSPVTPNGASANSIAFSSSWCGA